MSLASQPKRLANAGHEVASKCAGHFSTCQEEMRAADVVLVVAPDFDCDVKQPVAFPNNGDFFDEFCGFGVQDILPVSAMGGMSRFKAFANVNSREFPQAFSFLSNDKPEVFA